AGGSARRRGSCSALDGAQSARLSSRMFTLLMSCWLGFLIGLRHALDPDHLAAMSALVVEQPRRFRAAVQGAFWGAGHAAALLVTGALLLAWRIQLPERWAELFELAARPSARSAAAYLLVFALGSTGGMALLTGLLGVPIGRIARRPAAHAVLMAGIGAVSLLVGIVWGAPILGRLLSS